MFYSSLPILVELWFVTTACLPGFLTSEEACGSTQKTGLRGERFIRKSFLVGGCDQLDSLHLFVRGVLRSHLVTVAMHLNQVFHILFFIYGDHYCISLWDFNAHINSFSCT